MVPPLTRAQAVLSLPAEVASTRVPVNVRGVVTAAEPDWQGKFFVQDATAGVFVYSLGRQPKIGDFVTVSGVTSPGAYAPIVRASSWRKLGVAELPPAKEVPIDRLMAGAEDGQRVEVTGVVRSISFVARYQKLMVKVAIGGYRIRVFPKLPPGMNHQSLIASTVRVRGTAATSFNSARRQLTAVNLFVPRAKDFVVIESASVLPFEEPFVALGDIARYRPGADLGERIRVRGAMTLQRVGKGLYLQDRSGGLHVESGQATRFAIGQSIEAVGFLEFVNYQPVLKDAILREASESAMEAITAKEVRYAELRSGLHAAQLIKLTGILVDRSVREVRRVDVGFGGVRIIATIQTPEFTFTAESEDSGENGLLATVPIGSRIELEGVTALETGVDGRMRNLRLLLPNADAIRLLETPGWWTADRLLAGLLLVCLLMAAVVGWTLTVSKKNVMLRLLMKEKEQARHDLQAGHDLLERQVRERTEQLRAEMTGRKATELEFRAVLQERTRLARELHDTLAQALTGIALQVTTASKVIDRDRVDAKSRLGLALEFLRQSQIELRGSIWNLRNRGMERVELGKVILETCRRITMDSSIAIELKIMGEQEHVAEVVEENLLRIAQEAVSNVVKHARATHVRLTLRFDGQSVGLEVKDNGSGLAAEQIGGSRQFGLLGMRERAKRLGGDFELSGSPGSGTSVLVTVPLRARLAESNSQRSESA